MALPSPAFFLVQIAIVAFCARLAARIVRPLLQPPVVGEMIIGVLLGPSLLGRLWPGAEAALFPRESLHWLALAGQVGLAIHMLGAGLDIGGEVFRGQARGAASVSLAGLIAPFSLGMLVAACLYGDGELFGPGIGRSAACLFLGAAMSITAFPVLARILQDRGLTGTPLGALVLSAGAFDDLAAWAVVSALIWKFGAGPTLLLSAAFFLGLILPRDGWADGLRARVEPLSSRWLLPVYFVCSGLNVRLDLLAGPRLWGIALLILLAASVGKGGACWFAARIGGRPPEEAAAIGALMNARGLMELVILNMGLSHALITPTLFTMMALMAVATTFAAAPLYELTRRLAR
ncbi:MAG: cation:proton antiporter [Elusimicrobia bacterium]|nr:cation:proton antiporter [Elusimicrobiota bacterium]